MSAALADLSPAHAIRGIEANLQACIESFGHWPSATLHNTPELFSVATDIPVGFFNGIARAQFSAATVDTQIEKAMTIFKSKSAPMRWWITPSTPPPELGAHLEAKGIKHVLDAPGMTVDLLAINAPPAPPHLTIERVANLSPVNAHFRPAISGKVVIVTGASSGIGEATTREFARAGALAARRAERLQRLAAEIEADGGLALPVPTDLRQFDQITNLVQTTGRSLAMSMCLPTSRAGGLTTGLKICRAKTCASTTK